MLSYCTVTVLREGEMLCLKWSKHCTSEILPSIGNSHKWRWRQTFQILKVLRFATSFLFGFVGLQEEWPLVEILPYQSVENLANFLLCILPFFIRYGPAWFLMKPLGFLAWISRWIASGSQAGMTEKAHSLLLRVQFRSIAGSFRAEFPDALVMH